jgi:uncharacterized protein HemX
MARAAAGRFATPVETGGPDMMKSTIGLVIAAVLVGLLVGFLGWGLPTGRLKGEIQALRASSDRLSQQLDAQRAQDQQLAAQLKAQQARLEASERDLQAEKELNSRLHLLISQGKK